MKKIINEIENFEPINEQEANDKKIILDYIRKNNNVLLRENEIAHITSSGFIMNKNLDKVLMVYHNIYKSWSWTGGHADGEADLLNVALKEAKEETGISEVFPQSKKIISIDILPVLAHYKKGKYVSCHLHLSIAYLLIACEDQQLKVKEDENSAVKWIDIKDLDNQVSEEDMIIVYHKIIKKAHHIVKGNISH
ncbi:MAG: NUDIX hydrolase [Bacilli bacterium]|nr:NUDIX hydrolase [Bacilli bacterium]